VKLISTSSPEGHEEVHAVAGHLFIIRDDGSLGAEFSGFTRDIFAMDMEEHALGRDQEDDDEEGDVRLVELLLSDAQLDRLLDDMGGLS
jgi:hypothetical protein